MMALILVRVNSTQSTEPDYYPHIGQCHGIFRTESGSQIAGACAVMRTYVLGCGRRRQNA
jgi:hypothetical protein